MITAIHRKKLFPLLVMLVALAGMTLSVVGEAASHGIAELTETSAMDLDDHPHSHDHHSHDADEKPDIPLHHDSGNHTHESVDQLTIRLVSSHVLAFRQPVPFAGDSPRSFRYRLDRPPKASLAV
ncbi:hypothetical protein [Marinobacter sp.]|uniref:hypothetical protein n=1 Tax=Marinobacter sp. TaxID=50741 RepID=UPI0035612F0D